jgi:hypothetical protein
MLSNAEVASTETVALWALSVRQPPLSRPKSRWALETKKVSVTCPLQSEFSLYQ